ncbi:MAG TPA: DUF3458 domain-containing protein, partial [Caldimonas sp.]|nr:DUF3458 domain-containing protein [Caldimonas sp.]
MTLSQSTAPTPGQAEKSPLVIPVAMGLIGPNGDELATRLEEESASRSGTRVLRLERARQTFRFRDVPVPPVPSLLRGFSAPVKLRGVPLDRLKFLAIHDSDPFARWEASQQLATTLMLELVAAFRRGATLTLDPDLLASLRATLADADADPAFAAEALLLPSEQFLADQMGTVDVDAIHAVRDFARTGIGRALGSELAETYERLADTGPYRIDGRAVGRRALRNVALSYLARRGEPQDIARAATQFAEAGNMTDELAALAVLNDVEQPERAAALARFYERWRIDELVIDKWFSLQAMSSLPATLQRVRELAHHADFDIKNPNRVRALVSAFAQGNPVGFHEASGAGYAFLSEHVLKLDP